MKSIIAIPIEAISIFAQRRIDIKTGLSSKIPGIPYQLQGLWTRKANRVQAHSSSVFLVSSGARGLGGYSLPSLSLTYSDAFKESDELNCNPLSRKWNL